MLKKTIVLITLFALTLTACSATAGNQPGQQNSRTLNPMSELVVGTLKLDGTPNAVSKEQAAQLLPMWEVYKQLTSSDTAAQAEIDGLSDQIHETMTADQTKAIASMKLTQGDLFSFMQGQRAGSGTGPSSSSRRNSSGQGNGGNFFAGGGPGGGFSPGGDPGGFPGGGGFSNGGTSSRQGTGTQTASGTQAARSANPNRVPTILLDTLIQYLEKQVGPIATPTPPASGG
jgi:hypothetical protein